MKTQHSAVAGGDYVSHGMTLRLQDLPQCIQTEARRYHSLNLQIYPDALKCLSH